MCLDDSDQLVEQVSFEHKLFTPLRECSHDYLSAYINSLELTLHNGPRNVKLM